MRIDNHSVFKYLLQKGVSPAFADKQGRNAVHYAVQFGKLDFLIYLFEGDEGLERKNSSFDWNQSVKDT